MPTFGKSISVNTGYLVMIYIHFKKEFIYKIVMYL